jgi:hypothetical protein
MTTAVAPDSSIERLQRLEHVGLGSLLVCASVFVIYCAVEAVGTPRTFLSVVTSLPVVVLVALCVGTVASVVPASPLGANRGVRVGALVSLLGSVAWLAFAIGLGVLGELYRLAMNNFD